MPNGGPTPDCVHCQHFKSGDKFQINICRVHKINLAYPIRALCSNYVDPNPDEKGDWLDQKLDRSELEDKWMYVWIDWSAVDNWEAKGIMRQFEHFPLVPISEYEDWTREKFLEEMVKIVDKKR